MHDGHVIVLLPGPLSRLRQQAMPLLTLARSAIPVEELVSRPALSPCGGTRHIAAPATRLLCAVCACRVSTGPHTGPAYTRDGSAPRLIAGCEGGSLCGYPNPGRAISLQKLSSESPAREEIPLHTTAPATALRTVRCRTIFTPPCDLSAPFSHHS